MSTPESNPLPIHTRWVDIPVNGDRMQSYMAWPSTPGPWPAVIVFMEIFGVNTHIRSVTERIATEGYVAIAPNYYHRSTQNLELGYTERDVTIGRQHKEQTTREGLLIDTRAVLHFLQTHHEIAPHEVVPKDRLGCIGFCFGGHVAYIAAGMQEIAATASFYGGGIANSAPGGGAPTVTHSAEIQGEILCIFGETDPLIPHEDTVIIEQALKQAGVHHEVIRYAQSGHGFFCDQRHSYDPSAAEDAWHRVKALFHRTLKGQHPQHTPALEKSGLGPQR